MNEASICAETSTEIPAGKARWEYDRTYGANGGWVLQGCNCLGKYCQPPSGKGMDNEVRDVDCANAAPPVGP